MTVELRNHMAALSRSLETNSGKTLCRKMLQSVANYETPLCVNESVVANLLFQYWDEIAYNQEGAKIVRSLVKDFCKEDVLIGHIQNVTFLAAQKHADKIIRLQAKLARREEMLQAENANGKRVSEYIQSIV